jgi:hypothetical protein
LPRTSLVPFRGMLLTKAERPASLSPNGSWGACTPQGDCSHSITVLHGARYVRDSYCWRTYFTAYKAKIFARVASSLCAFRGAMCEAKFWRFRVRQRYLPRTYLFLRRPGPTMCGNERKAALGETREMGAKSSGFFYGRPLVARPVRHHWFVALDGPAFQHLTAPRPAPQDLPHVRGVMAHPELQP